MHEPMTAATDYVLTLASIAFAISLWRATNYWWSLGFLFTASGTFFGGTFHALAPDSPFAFVLWKLTTYSVGLASFALLAGIANTTLTGAWRTRVVAFALAKFSVYAVIMARRDDFEFVIADYGISLLVLAAIEIAAWVRRGDRAAPWVLASIVVMIVAALVQQSGIVLHRHFNYNDLYHVIQLVGLALLYRGGLLLTTPARFRPTIQPT